MNDLDVYDTTLRDGAQQEGLNLSVIDKLAIAAHLDELGVGFIEGGWPGANPKDTEFFARAGTELALKNAVLAAFGATRRADGDAASDPLVRALLSSGAPVITLVAKSHLGHVERALRTTSAENLAMVRDSVSFLVGEGRRVFLDAEHFFDGYAVDPAYALEVAQAAFESGAEVVALCDTNGGMLPGRIGEVVHEVVDKLDLDTRSSAEQSNREPRIGIHCHNDTGCAVANSMAAVDAGARHVQGTINGYGERTGNANLVTVVANLQLKAGVEVVEPLLLQEATRISHAISEITNVPAYSRQPYTGASAFAHKAGLHASAIKVDPDLYQHLDPQLIGNTMRTLISDMAGRASVELKARELGLDLDPSKQTDRELTRSVLAHVKDLELRGYTFDAADASFELLLRRAITGGLPEFFSIESWRVITESGSEGEALSEATVKLTAGGERAVRTGEGNGPVNALDQALRLALATAYPEIEALELIDYRVRILDAAHGTDAVTRVLIETSDGETTWETIGVAPNILEASWQALLDAVTYGLLRARGAAR